MAKIFDINQSVECMVAKARSENMDLCRPLFAKRFICIAILPVNTARPKIYVATICEGTCRTILAWKMPWPKNICKDSNIILVKILVKSAMLGSKVSVVDIKLKTINKTFQNMGTFAK